MQFVWRGWPGARRRSLSGPALDVSTAPADGVVTKVLASVGQQVERGQRLAEFEPQA
jgi:multidrug efflux pump subunit AcrA (membrane-fusion protein)